MAVAILTKVDPNGRFLAGGILAAFIALCIAVLCADPRAAVMDLADPKLDSLVGADIAWVLVSTALVMLMTPGLAVSLSGTKYLFHVCSSLVGCHSTAHVGQPCACRVWPCVYPDHPATTTLHGDAMYVGGGCYPPNLSLLCISALAPCKCHVITTSLFIVLAPPYHAQLFYGGMVRHKNVVSTILQCFITLGIITCLWTFVR